MSKNSNNHFFNRELSWLEFNQRVLELAKDPSVPVLDRLKFLAISASNLDEFFMVRVGGLTMLVKENIQKRDAAGLTPRQQLTCISYRVQKMISDQEAIFNQCILSELEKNGIKRVEASQLNDTQLKHCRYVFDNELFPVLSPVSLSNARPFPLLANRTLYFFIQLKKNQHQDSQPRFALLPVSKGINRFITLPAKSGYQFILVEDCIAQFIDHFFSGDTVENVSLFRITRNADMSIQEDLASDLLSQMEAVIDARKRSTCIRLEIQSIMPSAVLRYLKKMLTVSSTAIFKINSTFDFSSFIALSSLNGFGKLKYTPWPPQHTVILDKEKSLFSVLAQHDILLNHPYESFDPVVRFVQEAAQDSDVIAIKQTLYRTSNQSTIIKALKRAAENGKSVTALVELKARFDEARNIEWARQLEDSGVQVIYGIKGLKTHAKICIVIRREPQGIRRYIHFGTGNYNENTAKLYSDISYMTADEDLGFDASAFFNIITGYSRPQQYRKMEAAPIGLRDKILELIDAEIRLKKEGYKSRIMVKINSLVDKHIIEALYQASKTGIPVDLNVRGICCLRPGVPGLSETITVKSIVDRFLEHSRILYFYHGGQERVFISSADWMPRNLDKRIEHLVPVIDPSCKQKVVSILETYIEDTENSWQLQPDGTYKRIRDMQNTDKKMQSQYVLYQKVCDSVETAKKQQPIVFEPLWSPKNQQ